MRSTVVLAFHGSRDPRAAVTAHALARSVAAVRPDLSVHAAFLDLETPRLDEVLGWLSNRAVTVVPMLLTPAYHARVDIPTVVAAARSRGARIDVTEVLGAPTNGGTELLVAALRRHLRAADTIRPDAIVLAAAGSRDPRALAAVDTVAAALGSATDLPCRAGYASGVGPSVADVVADLRNAGATNIALASHFLAPGLLHDRAMLPAVPETAALMTEGLATGQGRVTPTSIRDQFSIRTLAPMRDGDSRRSAGSGLAVDLLPRQAHTAHRVVATNPLGVASDPLRDVPSSRRVATDPLGVAPEITELVLRRINAIDVDR